MASWFDLDLTNVSFWPRVGATVNTSGGGGTGAYVVPLVTAGAISGFNIVNGAALTGSYTSNFSAAISGSGTGASVTLTVSGGKVTGFTSLVGGSGYNLGGSPGWLLNIAVNVWSTLIASLAAWRDNVNGNLQQLTNLAALQLAPHAVPGSPAAGMLAVDTNNHLQFYDGTAFRFIPGLVPRAQTSNSTSQSIPNGAYTSITMDTNITDNASIHSTSVNTSRFTCPANQGGFYVIMANLSFNSAAGSNRSIRVLLNGSGITFIANQTPLSGNPTIMSGSAYFLLSAGDFLEIQTFQDSGGALGIGSSSTTMITMVRLCS